jgi:hypothetical protein
VQKTARPALAPDDPGNDGIDNPFGDDNPAPAVQRLDGLGPGDQRPAFGDVLPHPALKLADLARGSPMLEGVAVAPRRPAAAFRSPRRISSIS